MGGTVRHWMSVAARTDVLTLEADMGGKARPSVAEVSIVVIAHDLVYSPYCFRFAVFGPIDGDRPACQSIA